MTAWDDEVFGHVADESPVWIRPPTVIRLPHLRWTLYRGHTLKGIRWALCEAVAGKDRWYRLALPEVPTVGELLHCVAGVPGLLIAETLVDEVLERVPDTVQTAEQVRASATVRPRAAARIDSAVVHRLRRAIINGMPAPGEPVETAALAAFLEADEGDARDAVMQLVGEGLVELDPMGRPHVAPLDRALASSTVDMYRAVGLGALARALPQLTDDDLAELRRHSACYVSSLRAGDPDEAAGHIGQFFWTLLTASRSPELELVLRPLQSRFLRVLRLFLAPLDPELFVERHLTGLADIEARDTARVVALYGAQLELVQEIIDASSDAPWADARG